MPKALVLIELVKALFAYGIAAIVVIGGLLFLYKALFLPSASRDQLIIGAVISLVSAASTFVFGAEIATRAARQSERASAAAVQQTAAATQAAVNTTSTQP